MRVTVTLDYSTKNVIPPHCRKPRTVYATTVTTIEVPEVAGDDAPVAFRIADMHFGPNEYRWWDQRLWVPFLPHSNQDEPSTPGSRYFPADVELHAHGDGLDEALEEARRQFEQYLIIDGKVWSEPPGEPMYLVWAGGWAAGNSTTVLVANDTPNRDLANLFRADQFDLARDKALKIAKARNQTDDLDEIRTRKIEVLIPEAIRADPQRDAAIAHANQEIDVRLPRHVWQDLVTRIDSPDLHEVRDTIRRSIS